jgi:hypothetical protein
MPPETKLNLNQEASTGFGAWTAYTPSLTAISLSTGSLTFAYNQIGKTVFVRGIFSMGTTPAISGAIGIGLPVTASAGQTEQAVAIRVLDNGTNSYTVMAYFASTTRVDLYALKTDATYLAWLSTSSTVPFTWAVDDKIYINFTYEAA